MRRQCHTRRTGVSAALRQALCLSQRRHRRIALPAGLGAPECSPYLRVCPPVGLPCRTAGSPRFSEAVELTSPGVPTRQRDHSWPRTHSCSGATASRPTAHPLHRGHRPSLSLSSIGGSAPTLTLPGPADHEKLPAASRPPDMTPPRSRAARTRPSSRRLHPPRPRSVCLGAARLPWTFIEWRMRVGEPGRASGPCGNR